MKSGPDGSLIPMAEQDRSRRDRSAARYDVLLRLDDNPVVAPGHAVAVSMVAGPRAGLKLVQRLGTDPRSTPIVASTRSAATSSSGLATTPASRESWAWGRPDPDGLKVLLRQQG